MAGNQPKHYRSLTLLWNIEQSCDFDKVLLGGRGILEISEWECAAGTLNPLAYTRAVAAEFYYPRLAY